MHVICDARRASALALAALLVSALAACEGNDGPAGPTGPPGPPGPPGSTSSELDPSDDPPGIVVEVLELSGGSLASGAFQSGDTLRLRFRVDKDDGTPWNLADMQSARALVSGPTFNYQRVLPEVDDVAQRAVFQGDGTYEYVFAAPLPGAYAAPYNDSLSFGHEQGELTGDALLTGTYTVGLNFVWSYEVEGFEGETFHDVGETTQDFLLGEETDLAPRAVVGLDNCNACHSELRAHEGLRRDLTQCLMCHTAGAEDLNDPDLGGGTPDVTVEAAQLFHRLHNGRHLPSVNGIGVHLDGTLDYTKTPKALVFAGEEGLKDFSDVGFPVWPNRTLPMPKDEGWSALTSQQKAQEEAVRTGVTRCAACHGDPDGAGPLTAPAQGDLINVQLTRGACGDCHDDINWDLDYKVNAGAIGFMPPQTDDSQCIICHDPAFPDTALAVVGAHRHPVLDPSFNKGLKVELVTAAEGGQSDHDGTIDPGEGLSIRFRLQDDDDKHIAPSDVDSISVVLSGPSNNSNLVTETRIPTAVLVGPAHSYVLDLPETLQLEFVGDSTSALGDVFTTERPKHLNVADAETEVFVSSATTGGSSVLTAVAPALQNFVDLANPTLFERDDFVVIDDGAAGLEEYLKIQFVEGNRLWFSSPATPEYPPGLRHAHDAGSTVNEVTLTKKAQGQDYSLDKAAGEITELSEFGSGAAVLVTYTAGWQMPAVYPLAEHASPDLDETWGKWTSKDIVSGTYRVSMWAYRKLQLDLNQETNFYPSTSKAAWKDVAVKSATELEPYALISSGENCLACHAEIYFHEDTRRGFDACISCHGAAGSEDRPPYVAAHAPETPGQTVNFRTLLHSVHRGASLPKSATFTVVGEGTRPWPNNYAPNSYAKILFPPMPGATKHCSKCHGAANEAWMDPAPRDHPTAQGAPVRVWRAVCAACHDSDADIAHIDSQTSPSGAEACEICHGPGEQQEVELVHKAR